MKSGAQKRQATRELSGDLSYYLTLVKIEGHRTWRAYITADKGGFDRDWAATKHPKITERKDVRIDRITGQFDHFI